MALTAPLEKATRTPWLLLDASLVDDIFLYGSGETGKNNKSFLKVLIVNVGAGIWSEEGGLHVGE